MKEDDARSGTPEDLAAVRRRRSTELRRPTSRSFASDHGLRSPWIRASCDRSTATRRTRSCLETLPGAASRPHAAAGDAESVRLTTPRHRPSTVPRQRRGARHAPRPERTGVARVGSNDSCHFTADLVAVERVKSSHSSVSILTCAALRCPAST